MPHNNLLNFPKIEDRKELKEVYLSVTIRSFAFSIVSVFVPLYLLGLGFSFNEVLVFLMVFFGSMIFIAPFSGYLSTKIGIKHVTLLGPLLTIAYLILLFLLTYSQIPIYFVAFVGSLGSSLFWIPINSHFAKHSHYGRRGRETSYLVVGAKTVSVAGPLVGGTLITFFGFNWTFALACVILAGAIFPLFMSYEYKSKFKYKFRDMFMKRNMPLLDDFIFQGILVAATVVLFPIYIFLISASYEITGAVASFAGIGIALSAFLIGKYTDKVGKIKMMRIGGALNLVLWLFLMFAKIPILIYITSFFMGFFLYALSIPLLAFFCDKLGEHEHTEFMAFREIGLSAGRVIFFFLLLFFSLEAKFTMVFAMAAIASLYFIFADLG